MPSPRIPVPVRKLMSESVDDATLTRMWRRFNTSRNHRPTPSARAWALALASAVVAIGLAVVFVYSRAPTALRLADGREIPVHMADGAKTQFAFDDDSKLDVGAGTHLDLLESTGHAVGMAIRDGFLVADVNPGGPRVWRIECGPVTVEVVGTRFTIRRDPGFIRVRVERGAVLVRGEPVPDHVVRVEAGQSVVVTLAEAAQRGENEASVLNPPSASSNARTAREIARPTARTPSDKPVALSESSSKNPEPSATTAPSAADSPLPVRSVVDAALMEADVLRRAGRFGEAARVLERVLAAHGNEPNATLAEFSLGRLYLDSLGDPRSAVVHLVVALARGLPAALSEDAQARLVEARARAGDGPGARDAASRYHALYPDGRHTSEVDRWASSAP